MSGIESILTNEGKRQIRQFLVENISEVAVGTGDSVPRSTDTELDVEVYRGESSNEATSTAVATSRLDLGIGDANGNDISELMLFIEDDGIARLVFGNTTKTDDIELVFETEVRVNEQ